MADRPLTVPSALAVMLGLLVLVAPVRAHDYPTVDRVAYVQACMRDHPGPYYEMVNKCSCVLDTIARELPFDDYVGMTTATNANTIGGERGGYIRDVEVLQVQIRKFRALQAQALKSCMVVSDSASR